MTLHLELWSVDPQVIFKKRISTGSNVFASNTIMKPLIGCCLLCAKRWGRNGINTNYYGDLRNTRWKCDLTITEVTIAMEVNGNKE